MESVGKSKLGTCLPYLNEGLTLHNITLQQSYAVLYKLAVIPSLFVSINTKRKKCLKNRFVSVVLLLLSGKTRGPTKERRGGFAIDVSSLATDVNASGFLLSDWSFASYTPRDWSDRCKSQLHSSPVDSILFAIQTESGEWSGILRPLLTSSKLRRWRICGKYSSLCFPQSPPRDFNDWAPYFFWRRASSTKPEEVGKRSSFVCRRHIELTVSLFWFGAKISVTHIGKALFT